jgi:hypothetical protein
MRMTIFIRVGWESWLSVSGRLNASQKLSYFSTFLRRSVPCVGAEGSAYVAGCSLSLRWSPTQKKTIHI